MDLLGCSEIRPLLAASYDGELPVEGQIAVETHAAWCASCAGETRRLEAVSRGSVRPAVRALRATAVSSGTLATELTGLSATVVSRMSAERGQSVGARFGRLFEDMHVVWAMLVAATATAFCAVLIAAAMHGTAPGRSDSLAAIMTATASPGSNANPLRLNPRIQVPRVQPEAVMPALLANQFPVEDDDDEKLFALAAVFDPRGHDR